MSILKNITRESQYLKQNSALFPPLLKQIPNPPEGIYWQGLEPSIWLKMPRVAVVGSRKVSPYGREVTRRLAGQLARSGVVIISGLAYGIDSVAHEAALEAGGLTVAVLPTSLDRIYPASHQALATRIARQGSLISEYEPRAQIFKNNFIARNRLVSGLSDILLITEASLKSGSLHTARFALEQGKTVMAVPGNITSENSEGTNNLIKSGAIPATTADDVLFALGLSTGKHSRHQTFSGTPEQELLLKLIRQGVSDQDELAAAAKLDGPALATGLTALELSGHIRAAGGGRWTAV